MRAALLEAHVAEAAGEVPVGAVVVCNGIVVGAGSNAPVHTRDPSAHAEILALRAAAQQLGNYRLEDCELFVTLEPCTMCAGAMLHARLKRVVFGAFDLKTGAAGSVLDVFAQPKINHRTLVQGGLMARDCAALLQNFFVRQRARQRQMRTQSGGSLREDALRTPGHRFELLTDMAAHSCYLSDLPSLAGLRLHYIDTGPLDASAARLCIHGPTDWSYAWRSLASVAIHQEQRVVCPDLIGFGKSDKPKKTSFHTLARHMNVLCELIEHLNLNDVMLVVSDIQKNFATCLLASMSQRVSGFVVVHPDAMSPAALTAPFPNPGYEAALRAFASL